MVQPVQKIKWKVFKKVKNIIIYDPTNPLLDILKKKSCCISILILTLFTIAEVEASQMFMDG